MAVIERVRMLPSNLKSVVSQSLGGSPAIDETTSPMDHSIGLQDLPFE
ncbi:hypothetical protein [Acaryochloris sp. IP29b_bin.137]|nr:hypothetical protein [Acaryochloris sp. IP29b_bin.137]